MSSSFDLPPVEPAQQHYVELNSSLEKLNDAIANYASEVWGIKKNDLHESDRIFFAKLIYNYNQADFKDSPQKLRELVIGVKSCLDNYLNIAKGSPISPSIHPVIASGGSLFSVAIAINEFNELGGNLAWGAANITGVYFGEGPNLYATLSLNIASASIGVVKMMKDSLHYGYEKIKIAQANRQSIAHKEALGNLKDDEIDLQHDINRDLRNLEMNIAKRQEHIDAINENFFVDALMSSTFFSGGVVALASSTVTAGIASGALGGIAFGGILSAVAIQSLIKDRERSKALTKEIGRINDVYQELSDAEQGTLDHLKLQIVRVRRDNLMHTQERELRLSYVKNALLESMGILSIGGGIIAILLASGIYVDEAAVQDLGLGLGVVIFLTSSILIGSAIYKYRERKGGLMPEISRRQKELLELHAGLMAGMHMVSPIEEKPKLADSLLRINAFIDQKRDELILLESRHAIECQASKNIKKVVEPIYKRIDALTESEIEEVRQFLQESFKLEFTGMELISSAVGKRNFIKVKLSEWLTSIPE